ncbi:AAA family ATPase [Salinifilum aidingensis]
MSERFVVITGGPGSGKTSLVERLQTWGHARSHEAGRAVIAEQQDLGGPALPWRDAVLFAEHMLCWELRSYRLAEQQAGRVFFDRGVVDIAGFLRLRGSAVPAHITAAAAQLRYHREVFLAPFWPQIYARDAQRTQSAEEAAATEHALHAAYTEHGYTVRRLPQAPVDDRARFVLAHLDEHG